MPMPCGANFLDTGLQNVLLKVVIMFMNDVKAVLICWLTKKKKVFFTQMSGLFAI